MIRQSTKKARWRSWRSMNPELRRTAARRGVRLGWSVFRALLLIGLAYILLYPILYMVTMSVRDKNDMFDITVNWIPKHFTLYTLQRIWKAMEYPATLLNTIFLSGICSLLSAAVCSLAAYGFARFRFKGQGVMFALVVFSIIVPPSFYNMPAYIGYRNFSVFGLLDLWNLFTGGNVSINLIGTHWPMILPALFGVGLRAGLFIYLFRQFFKGMPKELEEAAYIDGCGYMQTFLRIMVPSAFSVFVTVFLFAFVWYWNDYQVASLMMGSSNMTLSTGLSIIDTLTYSLDAANSTTGTQIVDTVRTALDRQGACLLVIGPLILLYVVLQRYFVESIERTGLVE
jgi:ABC transporter, permease protein